MGFVGGASSTTPRPCAPATAASPWTPPWTSPRSPPTSSCSKRGPPWSWGDAASSEGRAPTATPSSTSRPQRAPTLATYSPCWSPAAFLPFLPMTALQLVLLRNVAYTVSCTAIPWDNVDEKFLREPKDLGRQVPIVSFMLWLGPASSVFDILTYAAMFFIIVPPWWWGHPRTSNRSRADRPVRRGVPERLVCPRLPHVDPGPLCFTCLQTEHVPFAGRSFPAASLTVLTLAGVAVVTALPYVPGLGAALGLSPLPLPFFGLLFACMVLYLLLCGAVKALCASLRNSALARGDVHSSSRPHARCSRSLSPKKGAFSVPIRALSARHSRTSLAGACRG